MLAAPACAGEVRTFLTRGPGVVAHADLDGIYQRFNEGYTRLDPALVAGLYAEDASYLAPDMLILAGRKAIEESFASFFKWARENGAALSITFEILDRRVSGELAYDVGIYTLVTKRSGKPDGMDMGKFAVVARKTKDGWRFQVDSYSGLKRPEMKKP